MIRSISPPGAVNDGATADRAAPLPPLPLTRGRHSADTSPKVHLVVAGAGVHRGERATVAITRRQLLRAGAASGALLLARPPASLASILGTDAKVGADRRSRVDRSGALRLVHADLHNHTILSDGEPGNALPELAFASMRNAGLDVAALTDHSGVGKLQGPLGCSECSANGADPAVGIDEADWNILRGLADGANADGSFVAVRGFEWSSPFLGHMNVWFSETWTDPLATRGVGAGTVAEYFIHEGRGDFALDPEVETAINELLRTVPEGQVSMRGFYDWLDADPSTPVAGGGLDGIAGFNHPGREGGRFGYFAFDQRIVDRVVSIEMFNRNEDYLFEGVPTMPSPLVECLDAGWKVGLLGVTDEHCRGDDRWGVAEGKGRTGLWLPDGDFSRAGVKAAMESRRFFATRERGLRLDVVTAEGAPMGSTIEHDAGDLTFVVDLDLGTDFIGAPFLVQVLQSGRPLPTIVDEQTITIPRPHKKAPRVTVPVDRANGEWIVLRITDPSQPADGRAPAGQWHDAGRAIAYASPFFLRPGAGIGTPIAAAARAHHHGDGVLHHH